MITINQKDLKQALGNKSREMEWYLDSKTGQLKLHSEDIDFGDDGAFADMLDMYPERYFKIEPIPAQVQFKIMVDFTNEVKDDRARVELAQSFAQKRPTHQYHNTLKRYPAVHKQWQKYQDKRHADHVIQWLAEQNISAKTR